MQAIILAAGRGNRLRDKNPDGRPKCLLEFGGRSLLSRQMASLADCVGYVVNLSGKPLFGLIQLINSVGAIAIQIVDFTPKVSEKIGLEFWKLRDGVKHRRRDLMASERSVERDPIPTSIFASTVAH